MLDSIINQVSTKPNALLLNVGFGNLVAAGRIVAVISPNSAPMKRLKDEARDDKRLLDVTQGRKTRSILITDSNHVILSAVQTETISQRLLSMRDAEGAAGASLK